MSSSAALIFRFASKVNAPSADDCWEWTGARLDHGYGILERKGGSRLAHRISYERGETGLATGARQRAKTHCPRAHEYTTENTQVDKLGKRSCRACGRDRSREAMRAKRGAAK